MNRRAVSSLVGLATAASFLSLAPSASAVGPALAYDFDDDGKAELVVGAPNLRVGSVRGAGGVFVLRGTGSGPSGSAKVITQATTGVPGAAESGDEFGAAVASADFNDDGYADLAVGSPGEAIGDVDGAGSITVVYGSKTGLVTGRAVAFTIPGGTSRYTGFGAALVAGDFTGDGVADLAVGAPGDDYVERPEEDYAPSGTVRVLPGGANGLTADGASTVRRQGLPDFDVGFGSALGAGDLDGDGVTDLVVGSDGDRFIDDGFAGSVSSCLGHSGGPTTCTRLWKAAELAEMSSIVVGNLSGDATPEIAIGVPYFEEDDPGSVRILQLKRGTTLTVAKRINLTQNSAGVPGSSEYGEFFGFALAVGDVDRDGYDDLAVGALNEDNRGRVTVVGGAKGGWRTSGNYAYDQDTPGIPGGAEYNDAFGSSVSLLDHTGDRRLDLTVGAPGENEDSGAITTLRGSGSRFTTSGSRTFGLSTLGYATPQQATFGDPLGR